MKQTFVSSWKASTQPRKQRKYVYNAPLHTRSKIISAHLSKDLRSKHGIRAMPVRVDDKVKVSRGKFKGTIGKVTEVVRSKYVVFVEGVESVKRDGSKVSLPMNASNLIIIELNANDKIRAGKINKTKSEVKAKPTTEKKSPAKKK